MLLKIPRVLFAGMTAAVSAMVFGFLEPTLNLHLQEYP